MEGLFQGQLTLPQQFGEIGDAFNYMVSPGLQQRCGDPGQPLLKVVFAEGVGFSQ